MRTEDGYIIQKCVDGNAAAFGLLVDKYKKSVYALAYAEVQNFHDAQDITQEVFIKVYKNLRSLKIWDNFVGWLYRVTTNTCKNWIRSEFRRPDSQFLDDQSLGFMENSSLNSYQANMVNELVQDALNSLPEMYRQVLTLRYFGGMKVKEISRFIGVSPRTIDRRLREAHAQIKEEMLAMMSINYEYNQLPASITFRIVEMVKRIKIQPTPRVNALPWGLSLAAGIIFAIMALGSHIDISSPVIIPADSSLASETRVLITGEISVDILKASQLPIIAHRQENGDGGEPGLFQNNVLMAPQGGGDTWTKKADMPTARSANSCELDGKIYVIGGSPNDTNVFRTVEEYDPATDKWTRKADMPTARDSFSVCAVNGKIYAIGGWTQGWQGCDIVEEYDPVADNWTRKADMPTVRWCLSASIVNGKIYAIGGWNRAQVLPTVEEYDPAMDKWTKKSDMLTARDRFTTSVVDGKIYAIGGTDRILEAFATTERYDPVADEWTRKADMLAARAALSSCVINGRIYAVGGANGLAIAVSEVEEYDPVEDRWSYKANMPTKRAFLSADAVDGKIYAIGGIAKGWTPLQTVEEYTPEEQAPNNKPFSISPRGKVPALWGGLKSK